MSTHTANEPLLRDVQRPPKKRSRNAREEERAGWIAVSPWVIGFIIFTLGPLIASAYFSLTEYDVLRPPRWVGLENYRELLTEDDLFWKSVRNTAVYALLYVPLHVITALGVALLLNRAARGQSIFRTLIYLPAMTPAVATAYLWVSILNPNDGWVNRALRALHLPAPGWTVDPLWTKPAIVISQIWIVGGAMVIILAALQGIPKDVIEAAKLDGASAWRRLIDVTIPMISSVLLFIVTIATISSLNVFTQGYVMFNKEGGPDNSALFIVMYLFRQGFEFFQMGYVSAIAWVLFVLIMIITLIQFRLSSRWVYYESE
jgi:multiple sugar transport system permease protein